MCQTLPKMKSQFSWKSQTLDLTTCIKISPEKTFANRQFNLMISNKTSINVA